jgi:uncharacterized protein RhaS with RHS repeats
VRNALNHTRDDHHHLRRRWQDLRDRAREGRHDLLSHAYTYDAADRRTSATTSGQGTETYGYDQLNRLTSASYPGGPNVTYTYDRPGTA